MDPALMQQIMGAAPLAEQQSGVDQQIADILARRRAYQPQHHTTGLGALLGGIGDVMKLNGMNDQEDKLRQQHADIANKIAAARGAYAGAWGDATQPVTVPPEMIAAPGNDRATLEGEQQQQQRKLQMLGMLSGDPTMGAYVKQAPELALAGEKVKGAQLEQAIERQKMEQAGPQAGLGGQTPNVFELLTKRKMASQIGINPITGQPYQKTGGGGGPAAPGIAGPGGGGGESPPLYDKRLDPMLKSLRDDLDASISRGGVMKGNQERLNAAQRLLTLAVDPLTGGPANLTPQQMSEVSTSLATLIGGGGSSEGSRHELTPYTKGRTMAEVMQWLSDKPQGADQQAFVKQMIDTARREQGTAENAIRTAQAQRLPLHNQLFGLFPRQAQDALSAYGFEPGTVDLGTGKYTPKAKPPPSAGGGGTARVKYRDQLLDIPRARLAEALKDGAVEVTQ